MTLARLLMVGAVLVTGSWLGACYRPHLVDCVVKCERTRSCADGMTCSPAGLCTRGATCVFAVASGARHSCGLRGSTVACWGNNIYGQVGAPTSPAGDGELQPRPFTVDLEGQAATALAAGGRHTCAVLAGDGAKVECWGDDALGQLGGTAATGATRSRNVVSFGSGHAILSISAGLNHTCVVDNDDGGATQSGVLRCWGDARLGQLGPPAQPTAATAPSPSGLPGVNLGDARAVTVSAGAYHTCAMLDNGALACWGWNDYWQVGRETVTDPDPAAVVTVDVGGKISAVAAGGFQTCAILNGGENGGDVACWGQDDAGQLGIAPPDHQPGALPTAIDLGRGRTARSISVGTSHACALLDDFSVKCWGLNLDGELGVGDLKNRGADGELGDALARVGLGQDPVSMISAGANHTCAIQGADIKCWGSNDSGRLGTGNSKNDDLPRPIVPVKFGM